MFDYIPFPICLHFVLRGSKASLSTDDNIITVVCVNLVEIAGESNREIILLNSIKKCLTDGVTVVG